MNEKLFEKLSEYSHSHTVPMHMPGHKRNFGIGNELDSIYNLDITEIDGFDNLHHPTGIIAELQAEMSRLYGSGESLMLVNGSTAGILAAVSAAATQSQHKKLIIARNCHKSVYNALYLNNLEVAYIYPEYDEKMGIWGKIQPQELEKLLTDNQDVCGVLITSPTYEGIVSDISELSKLTRQFNIPLIVDSAHGAHFNFMDICPKTALELGADIVIESLHKTLPSLTQTAVLHIGRNSLVHSELIKRFVDIYQSTSPSYILMAAISGCMDFVQNNTVEFENYARNILELKKLISELKNIKLYPADDISKIILYTPYKSGVWLFYELLNKYNIQLEMASQKYVIAMTSVCDSKKYYEQFLEALNSIDFELNNQMRMQEINAQTNNKLNIRMNFRQAMDSQSYEILLDNAINKISAQHIIAYPPGCPVIAAGEEFDQPVIDTLKQCINMGIEIIGVEAGKVKVVR